MFIPHSNNLDTCIKWCGLESGSEKGYQENITCLKEIGLCARDMVTIVGLMVNIKLRGGGGW